MCGIVGYVGPKQAYPILMKGLYRLEYRGYDSAGIALLDGDLKLYKTKGKVSDLEKFVEGKDINREPLASHIHAGLLMANPTTPMHTLIILSQKILQ